MGIFNGVRIYPISRDNFGRLKLLDFSSCVGPFCPKICELLPLMSLVQVKKQPSPIHPHGRQENE